MDVFIFEDPGKSRTTRDRELQSSKAKAHAAASIYKQRKAVLKRRRTLNSVVSNQSHEEQEQGIQCYNRNRSRSSRPTASQIYDEGYNDLSPTLTSYPRSVSQSLREGRSFQFFIERTAPECVGWYDSTFWRVVALQTSVAFSTIRHGLISLGAYHEAKETKDPQRSQELRDLSSAQSRKALASFADDSSTMSYSALVCANVVIHACSSCVHPSSGLISLGVCYDLLDRLRSQQPQKISSSDQYDVTQTMEPIMRRRQSRDTQIIDMLFALKQCDAEHFATNPPLIPLCIVSLLQARDSLEGILNWTAYQVKKEQYPVNTVPKATDNYLARWSASLDAFCASTRNMTEADSHSVSLLRVVAKISIMMIKTFDCEDETIFDQHTDTYRELADVFERVCNFNKRETNFSWRTGLESSLVGMVGNAGLRWCRDPPTRRRFVDLLCSCGRQENIESALTWSGVVRRTQELEEKDIFPPPLKAQDIPASKRLRVNYFAWAPNWDVLQTQYLRAPYRDTDTMDIFTTQIPGVTCMYGPQGDLKLSDTPGMIMGRGYTAWPTGDSTKPYYTSRSNEFYFNLPRI